MPPTYTPNLGIHKPATGEEAGTWGTVANTNYDILDTGIDGNTTIALASSGFSLATAHDAVSVGNNKVVIFTGNLSGPGTITISPNNIEKIYYIVNHTTGGQALTITQGSGGSYVLPNGYAAMVYCDGLGGTAAVKGVLADLQVNSLLVSANLIVNGQITWGGGTMTVSQPATFSALVTMPAGATISAPLTLALGGDAAYDMYYRSAAGAVARLGNGSAGSILLASGAGPSWLANGASGQVLMATPGGPSWASPPAPPATGIGAPISGASGNFILYVNAAGNLAQDSQLIWRPTFGLGIGKNPVYPIDVQGDINLSAGGVYRVNGNPLATGIGSLPYSTAQASANQGLGGSYVDIPNTLIFPPVAGHYLVMATVHFQGGADPNLNINVQLLVNGVPQAVSIWYAPGSNGGSEGTASGHWIVGALATSMGVKLQGARAGGSGSATVTSATTISMVWIAP